MWQPYIESATAFSHKFPTVNIVPLTCNHDVGGMVNVVTLLQLATFLWADSQWKTLKCSSSTCIRKKINTSTLSQKHSEVEMIWKASQARFN